MFKNKHNNLDIFKVLFKLFILCFLIYFLSFIIRCFYFVQQGLIRICELPTVVFNTRFVMILCVLLVYVSYD